MPVVTFASARSVFNMADFAAFLVIVFSGYCLFTFVRSAGTGKPWNSPFAVAVAASMHTARRSFGVDSVGDNFPSFHHSRKKNAPHSKPVDLEQSRMRFDEIMKYVSEGEKFANAASEYAKGAKTHAATAAKTISSVSDDSRSKPKVPRAAADAVKNGKNDSTKAIHALNEASAMFSKAFGLFAHARALGMVRCDVNRAEGALRSLKRQIERTSRLYDDACIALGAARQIVQAMRDKVSEKNSAETAEKYHETNPNPVESDPEAQRDWVEEIQKNQKGIPYRLKKKEKANYRYSGLIILASMLRSLPLDQLFRELEKAQAEEEAAQKNEEVKAKRSKPKYTTEDILVAMGLVIAIADPDYASVNKLEDMAEELGFARGIPGEDCLRKRLGIIASNNNFIKYLNYINRDLLCALKPKLRKYGEFIVIDVDTSPFDNSKTHKEGCSRTYKPNIDGFTPMMCYIGAEDGYLLSIQLREGKASCQVEGTVPFFVNVIRSAKKITKGEAPLLFRADSGHDSADTMTELVREGVFFVIRHNPRQEDAEARFHEYANTDGVEKIQPRSGKTVLIGSRYIKHACLFTEGKDNGKKIRVVFEMIERTSSKTGEILEQPEYEIKEYYTNTGMNDREVIDAYHHHGTMEQYHSEFKTDLNLERLPSSNFATNELVCGLGMLVFNMLRILGHTSLEISSVHTEALAEAKRREQQYAYASDTGSAAKKRSHNKTPGFEALTSRYDYDGKVVLHHTVARLRIKTVIEKLVYVPGYTTKSGNQRFVNISRQEKWWCAFDRCWEKYASQSNAA